MKRSLILVLLALGALASIEAVPVQRAHAAVIARRNATPITYLVDLDFEETGTPGGVSVDAGAPEFDYTTVILAGAQSCRTIDSAGWHIDFTGTADCWGYAILRLTNTDTSEDLIKVQDASSNELMTIKWVGTFHRLRITSGASGDEQSANDVLPRDTTIYLWWHYVKGSGANSEAHLYWSSTTTKPGSPGLSITGENETANASRLRVAPPGGAYPVMDNVKVAAQVITSQ